jgi:UDP-glucose 4-epimerase
LNGKKVLVTGGAGFIGSTLVQLLKEAGASVVVVDNLVNGKQENLERVLGNQVRLEVADICDQDRMSALIGGMDVVFHLACLGVRHSIHAPQENHDINATATLNLLEIARELKVGRFVYVSSSEVYGTAKTVPMDENHPTFPHTIYGASKLAGECFTRAYHDTYNMDTVIVRPFNAYGPRCHHEGDSGEVIPKFMLRCMADKPMVIFGDGQQTRDFTYVDDTAAGILLAGNTDAAIGETINLGSGYEITVNELAQTISKALGQPEALIQYDAPRPGDVLRLYANSEKAKKLLGFQTKHNFAFGIQQLMEWYQASSVSAEALLEQETAHNWETGSK